MENNITYESKAQIGQYIVTHTISIPSRVTDYDYDPEKPNKRFISTLIHQLVFLDSISGIEIMSINFSSDECAQILSDLYEYSYKASESSNPFKYEEIGVNFVHIKGHYRPAAMTIFGSSSGINIRVQLEFFKALVSIDISHVQSLIDLLDTEILFSRYVDELIS